MIPGTHCCPECPISDEALSASRFLALAAVNAARAELDHIAAQTYEPDPRDVQAADLLDTVHDLLARSAMP
jgi:hypothetical protein